MNAYRNVWVTGAAEGLGGGLEELEDLLNTAGQAFGVGWPPTAWAGIGGDLPDEIRINLMGAACVKEDYDEYSKAMGNNPTLADYEELAVLAEEMVQFLKPVLVYALNAKEENNE